MNVMKLIVQVIFEWSRVASRILFLRHDLVYASLS